MLQWQSEPLHTSMLGGMERRVRIAAIQSFHLIQGYMEDDKRRSSIEEGKRRSSLKAGEDGEEEKKTARQLCDMAIRIYGLRDEIYLQLMKQLEKNPSSTSRHRGWKLMEICLKKFPPSDELENFLDYFCRQRSRIKQVKLMYRRIYLGADQVGIHHQGIQRRLSSAGLLWQETPEEVAASKAREEKRAKKHAVNNAMENAMKKTKKNAWDGYSTPNSVVELTEDALLVRKKKNLIKPKKRLGRHTKEIIKRLGKEAKNSKVLAVNLQVRQQQKESKSKQARERKEDLKRVLGSQSSVVRLKGGAARDRARRNGATRKFEASMKEGSHSSMFSPLQRPDPASSMRPLSSPERLGPAPKIFDWREYGYEKNDAEALRMHEQWLRSMGEYVDPYDVEGHSYLGLERFEDEDAIDRRALHEQWQEERYANDNDGVAFLHAHVRGQGGGGTPSTNVRGRGQEKTEAEKFSGLTARKIITKVLPKNKHIRTYTMQDVLAYK